VYSLGGPNLIKHYQNQKPDMHAVCSCNNRPSLGEG